MAKENTHCKFSLNVLQKKELQSNVKEILQKNQLIYLYSSAFPDSFYYTKSTIGISTKLHNGEYDYQRLIDSFIENPLENREIAFLFGLISHLFLDLNIHPLVNNVCGKGEYCHLKLESELDVVYSQKWKFFTFKNLSILKKQFPHYVANRFFNIEVNYKKILSKHFYYNLAFKNAVSAVTYKTLFKNSPKVGLFYSESHIEYDEGLFLKTITKAEDKLAEIFNITLEYIERKINKEEYFSHFPKGCLDGF